MSKAWLFLNEIENQIDEDIGHAQDVVYFWTKKIDKLVNDKRKLEELRKLEEKLSKKGFL